MDGMPRRVADYAAQFGNWNLLISCCAFLLGAAQLGLPLQHDRQLALRPDGRAEPVARELDRVAGLLAAADLQLRRDPARRRRPVRVRRSRREARDHARRGVGGQKPKSRGGDAHVTERRDHSRRGEITDVGTPSEHASEVVAAQIATFGDRAAHA